MSRILVFGKDGQVGQALGGLLGLEAVMYGREEANFLRPESLRSLIQLANPLAVINAAAYTAVDRAEDEEAAAFTINAEAPLVLAEECKKLGIPLVHYSTDYVFNGTGNRPWHEDMPVAPANIYGKSKRAGEEAIMSVGGDYLILRTSWVYDAMGRNFLTTMLRLGAERERLSVVSDQIGAPTYALHLADRTVTALHRAISAPRFPTGIYHVCNAGETSWYNFAKSIFTYARQMGCELKIAEVQPILSADYPTPAKRPKNSRLDCTKAQQSLGIVMPHWEVGLREAIRARFRPAPIRTRKLLIEDISLENLSVTQNLSPFSTQQLESHAD
jgi:dTDP-4-dehydrorhamnose reductase